MKIFIHRWDHNGFLELYPEEAQKGASSSKSPKESSKKYDTLSGVYVA